VHLCKSQLSLESFSHTHSPISLFIFLTAAVQAHAVQAEVLQKARVG
jgi:hypothetical protein